MRTLLNLQNYDLEKMRIESQLLSIPVEINGLERKKEEVKAQEKAMKEELREKEVTRNHMDGEVKASEEKVIKYKTQQLEVKKNEEYAALNKEIEREEVLITEVEDKELELLLEIDEFKEKVQEKEKGVKERVEEIDGQVKHLKKREEGLQTKIEKIAKIVSGTEDDVDAGFLKKYQQLKVQIKRGPYVVPLEAQRCKGCHLTVSNEIDSLVQQGDEIVQCGSCSRMLYAEDE